MQFRVFLIYGVGPEIRRTFGPEICRLGPAIPVLEPAFRAKIWTPTPFWEHFWAEWARASRRDFVGAGFLCALSHRLKNCEIFEIAGLVRNRGVSENVVPTAAEYIVAAAAGKW